MYHLPWSIPVLNRLLRGWRPHYHIEAAGAKFLGQARCLPAKLKGGDGLRSSLILPDMGRQIGTRRPNYITILSQRACSGLTRDHGHIASSRAVSHIEDNSSMFPIDLRRGPDTDEGPCAPRMRNCGRVCSSKSFRVEGWRAGRLARGLRWRGALKPGPGGRGRRICFHDLGRRPRDWTNAKRCGGN